MANFKYSRTADFLILAAEYASKNDMVRAAKALTIASKRPDIKAVLASLDALQSKALAVEQASAAKSQTGKTRSTALAQALQEAAARKANKGKKPMAKKKGKAKANTDEFEGVLDEMVEESTDESEVDLDLVDLEDTLDDGVEEMPLASGEEPSVDLDGESLTEDEVLDQELSETDEDADEDDEDSDEDSEDEADDGASEDKTETAAKKSQSMARAKANLAALARVSRK